MNGSGTAAAAEVVVVVAIGLESLGVDTPLDTANSSESDEVGDVGNEHSGLGRCSN